MAKSKARRMGKKSRGDGNSNPATSLVVYRGAIRTIDRGVPQDEVTIVTGQWIPASASGSLGMQGAVGNGNVSSSADWTRFAGLYDEYRVLGFRIDWRPHYGWGNNTVIQASGLWITTHQPTNPTPFTSLNQMIDYQDWSEIHTGKQSSKEWKMSSTEESQFTPTAGPVTGGYICWFIPTATTTSVVYGNFYVTYRVQFRGRI